MSLAVATVDSVRAVDIERAALLTHGLVLGFTAAVLIAWRASGDD